MPDGRTHDIITIATAAAVVPAAMMLGGATPGQAAILAGSCLVSGIAFSCDLDLRSDAYLRWGRFRFLWWPYQKIVHHRAVWSHGLVIGPLLRILYFVALTFLLLYLGLQLVNLLHPIDPSGTTREAFNWIVGYINRHPQATLLALLGFIIGGAAHTIPDIVTTEFKRRRRKILKRLF